MQSGTGSLAVSLDTSSKARTRHLRGIQHSVGHRAGGQYPKRARVQARAAGQPGGPRHQVGQSSPRRRAGGRAAGPRTLFQQNVSPALPLPGASSLTLLAQPDRPAFPGAPHRCRLRWEGRGNWGCRWVPRATHRRRTPEPGLFCARRQATAKSAGLWRGADGSRHFRPREEDRKARWKARSDLAPAGAVREEFSLGTGGGRSACRGAGPEPTLTARAFAASFRRRRDPASSPAGFRGPSAFPGGRTPGPAGNLTRGGARPFRAWGPAGPEAANRWLPEVVKHSQFTYIGTSAETSNFVEYAPRNTVTVRGRRPGGLLPAGKPFLSELHSRASYVIYPTPPSNYKVYGLTKSAPAYDCFIPL